MKRVAPAWALAAVLLAFFLAPAARGQDAAPVPLLDPLVIDGVGVYGRVAVHRDAIQAAIAAGSFTTPEEGDEVVLPDGAVRQWTRAETDEQGRLNHAAMRGGYALYTVRSPKQRVRLLDARGHGTVYVNGVPRVGDPYGTGFVRVPVLLEAGENTLLFHARRGSLSAALVEPTSRISFNVGDLTMPDLIVGEATDTWGGIIVLNATTEPLGDLRIVASLGDAPVVASPVPPVPPLGMRKVGFAIRGPMPPASGKIDLKIELIETLESGTGIIHDESVVTLKIQEASELQKRTRRSRIDGSVQYYAVRPAGPLAEGDPRPGIVLSLHGAGVGARGQASNYQRRTWGHIVAPTNRRPFGFDWEDWGRIDALETLEEAGHRLPHDPRRVWLTGHSMGGHGTWNLGATMPDRFAALGPSAGWISFWSYSGAVMYDEHDPIESMLARAAATSDTAALLDNYLHHGIYVLHGDKDSNVPVEQARVMRGHLGAFHPDFAYYERPGAGHWWGSQCMDWPPLMEFLQRHERPDPTTLTDVAFTTMAPGVSGRCHWATIETQEDAGRPSTIDLHLYAEGRRIEGETRNVARLGIDLRPWTETPPATGKDDEPAPILPAGDAIDLRLDEQDITAVPWPDGGRLWVERDDEGTWSSIDAPDPADKGPHRDGRFKTAFGNRVLLVYGTAGDDAENTWARDKARYDAETFWYRGNGSLPIVADTDFDPANDPDRNVVLYGNADTNTAWSLLLAESPVQVRRDGVTIGDRDLPGDDLGALLIRPRPGSRTASVGVVTGTTPHGMHLTDRLPYFVSGVGYPDIFVVSPEILTKGTAGIRAAGFFGNDWSVENGDVVVRGE